MERNLFTINALAERWGCSGETVRSMILRGDLPAFRVGRAYRITAQVVEDHECGTIASEGSKGAGSSYGMRKMEGAGGIALRLRRDNLRRGKLVS